MTASHVEVIQKVDQLFEAPNLRELKALELTAGIAATQMRETWPKGACHIYVMLGNCNKALGLIAKAIALFEQVVTRGKRMRICVCA